VTYGFKKKDSTVSLFWANTRQWIRGGADASVVLRNICNDIIIFSWDPGDLIIMPPNTAKVLADRGLTQKDVLDYIVEYARVPATGINLRWYRDNNHEPDPEEYILPFDDPTRSIRKFYSSKHSAIVVAGMSYAWHTIVYGGGGSHGTVITKKIQLPANWDKLIEKYKDITPSYVKY
jgi:hypothetical protein